MNEKKATPNIEAAPKHLQAKSTATIIKVGDNSAAAQRSRVLDAMRGGPKSTIQLRRDWDVLAPAARVLELKRRGFEILTRRVHEATECGKLHCVALYVLLHETGGQT
jgi:hypothetical protein